ncbi:uncharacterized protein LOC143208969 isoform X2 [Lasioglossum baleicum]|uniref:uncharacterized protein LOC143208969 isoform X2 n=1 Tax=Lasioglossum baleicum TaxID=434251 RepID=UPI003FCE1324
MDEKGQDTKYNIFMNTETEGDSILDFKSPESNITKTKLSEFVKPTNIKQKKKATTKLKSIPKNQKDTKSKQQSEKRSFQPSIESSYFKFKNNDDNKDSTTNLQVALVCPLCFKTFKDVDSQVAHMKICACKNNISTKKLLDAIELQKRQEDERKLLGLLAAPIVQEKKKSVARKVNSHDDSDFDLALALSKSLHEVEEFVNVQPVNVQPAILVKNRKRVHNVVTVLKTRTQEERNRILTERIAEILMGDEPFTQKPNKEIICNKKFTVKTDLKSYLLQDLFHESEKLWDKAELPRSEISFYVSNLSEYIFPREKQLKECEEDNREPSEDKTEKSMDEKTFCKMSQNDLHLIDGKCENCNDRQYIDSLLNNWGNTLNDSSASDIIVFVDNNKYIWAHKLVFYVQCSNILLDVMPNDNSQFTTVKEKICWPDITYSVALAFLEFIYSGNIKKHFDVCKNEQSSSTLRSLARKYKVKELFAYLQRKGTEIKQQVNIQTEKIKDNVHGKILNVKEDDNLNEYASISQSLLCEKKKECKELLYKDEQSSEEERIKDTVHRRILNVKENDNLNEYASISQSLLCEKKKECKESLYKDEQSSEEYLEDVLNNSESFETGRKSLVLPATDTLTVKVTNMRQISSIRQCNESPDMFDDVNDSIRSCEEKSVDHIIVTDKSQRSNNTDIVDSTDVDIDTVTISSNIEENMNSLASTPQSSRPTRRSLNKSDSDTTITARVTPKLKRNPFNLQSDNSDQNFIVNNATLVKGESRKETDVLNKFDYVDTSFPLHLHTKSVETDINVNLDLNSMDNLTQLLENNEEIYTQKYSKSNSTNSNTTSAESAIQNAINSPVTEPLSQNSESVQNLDSSIDNCNESDSSVLSDSHSDDGELSMYTKYKKKHENNSIVKYRNFPEQHVLNNFVKNSSKDDYCEAKNNMNMEDIPILSDEYIDLEMDSDFTLISENGKVRASNLEKSLSFSQYPTNFNETFDNEHEKTVNSSKLRYTKSESNINMETKRNNLLVSSPEQKTKSPILILSSPEIDFVTTNIDTRKKIVANEVSNLNEFHDNTHIFEKDIYLANVRIDDDNDNDGKNDESITTVNDSMIQSAKPLVTKENIRKLKRKSMSETNLNANGKSKKDRKNDTSFPFDTVDIVDTVNRSPCNCGHNKVLRKVKSPTITRDSCTPPPDYDSMKTPELHAELHRYGLKLQKRSRAVKLLTYIYNELHPTIPLTSKKVVSELVLINSDDEEEQATEPAKRRRSYSKDDDNNYNNEYSYDLPPTQGSTEKSPINIIDKRRRSIPNIKDVFLELIKDQKELYNNILSYKPLCIDSVHSMLKGKGFKYKMNTLMDFLDEQCITFYFQDTKQSKKLEKVNGNTKTN